MLAPSDQVPQGGPQETESRLPADRSVELEYISKALGQLFQESIFQDHQTETQERFALDLFVFVV
jgi:hypothetical protein